MANIALRVNVSGESSSKCEREQGVKAKVSIAHRVRVGCEYNVKTKRKGECSGE